MSDTTSTPEEPEARGTVATGGTGPVAPADGTSKPASAPGGNGAAAGNGAAKAPAETPQERDAVTVPENVATANGAEKPSFAKAAPAPADPAPAPDRPSAAAPTAATPVPPADPAPPADGPTVVNRQPIAPNGRPPSPSSTGGFPAAGAPVPGPRPAPGPVPGPGPDAAPPPPWNRVPGQEGRERQDAPPPHRTTASVGDLLGDGPTVVMGPGSAQSGEQGRPPPRRRRAAGRPFAPPAGARRARRHCS